MNENATQKLTKAERDHQMFGCDADEILEAMKSPLYKFSGVEMLAMSILSDAQEVISRGESELGRKFINRAKLVLDTMMRDRLEALG